MNKAEGELMHFRGLTKQIVMTAKDKAWYKNVTNMCASIDKKCAVVDGDLKSKLMSVRKRLDATVVFTKAYKQWVKKGGDEVFQKAWEASLEHCQSGVCPVELSLPSEIECDIQRMLFSAGLLEQLAKDRVEEVHRRFAIISNSTLSKLCTSEEMREIQQCCLQQIFIDILTPASTAAKLSNEDRDNMLRSFAALFHPFPHDENDVPKMPFQLSDGFAEQMSSLKMAIDPPNNMSKSALGQAVEKVVKLERCEDSQVLLTCFVSAPNGVRLLKFAKDKLISHQTALDRADRLSLFAKEFAVDNEDALGVQIQLVQCSLIFWQRRWRPCTAVRRAATSPKK